MEKRPKKGLDHPTFRGRIRSPGRSFVYDRPHAPSLSGMRHSANKLPKKSTVVNYSPHHTSEIETSPQLNADQLPVKTDKIRPDLPKQMRSHVLQRHSVKTASKKYRPKYHRPIKQTLIFAFSILLILIGFGAVFVNVQNDRSVNAQSKSQKEPISISDQGSNNGIVSENNDSGNVDDYKVAANLPRLLSISKLNVRAKVLNLGIDDNSYPIAPSNIFDVGWYNGSAKPGDVGAVVMSGHVYGETKHGVFYGLGSIKPGDKIVVERGDGKLFNYSVIGSQIFDYDKIDMEKVLAPSVPGKQGLNLLTSTGRFNVRTNQFEQRIVVFAVLDS